MGDEYTVTIREAINLWECLESMRIRDIEISVNVPHVLNAKHSKFQFSVKGYSGKVALVDYDDPCTITLDDHTAKIIRLTALQLRITSFIAKQIADKLFATILARKRKEWEAELDDTVIIPVIDIDDEELI